MEQYLFLFNEWWYILILIGIMLITGIIKQYGLFVPIYNFLIRHTKNKKILAVLLSLTGGVLPVPGRVIVSAGLLDTIASDKPEKRSKFGIIDYLATHHYYLWSPLEKTIIIPMAVLNLTYLGVLGYTWPLLFVSLLFLFFYIYRLEINDIDIVPLQKKQNKQNNWLTYINWKTVIILFCVIVAGNIIKHNNDYIRIYVEHLAGGVHPGTLGFIWLSIIAFCGSFIMGSSSKFAGVTALLTSIFGLKYFTFLFAIEFAGYLLSPMHKCVSIGMLYFKTPLKDYLRVLIIWSVLLCLVGLITIF